MKILKTLNHCLRNTFALKALEYMPKYVIFFYYHIRKTGLLDVVNAPWKSN